MKRWLTPFFFSLLLVLPALGQTSPQQVVKNFYADYTKAMATPSGRWVEALMASQGATLEQPLRDGLTRLAQGDPGKAEPFLDFDPFSNSQMGLSSYTIGNAVMKDGLAYVPVAGRLEGEPGPEKVWLRMVLRQSGQTWKIANLVYPADNGMAAWDLKAYLADTFK